MPKCKRKSARTIKSQRRNQRLQAQKTNCHDGEITATDQTTNKEEQAIASMGLAPSCKEKPLAAWKLASQNEKTLLNALRLSPPQGSRLSASQRDMSANPESPAWDCTPERVPLPKSGIAGQTQTGEDTHSVATEWSPSIMNTFRKGEKTQRNDHEIEKEKNSLSKTDEYDKLQRLQSKIKMKTNERISVTDITDVSVISHSNDKVIQGNFHQGNAMFGKNAGSQCVANCLCAAIYNHLKPVSMWQSQDMDKILITGNELYGFLQESSTMNFSYLLINELPRVLDIYNDTFEIIYKESIASIIGIVEEHTQYSDFNAHPMEAALQMSLRDTDCCFVCFGGNTLLVGKQNNTWYIFDSHSRSEEGMLQENGKSTCIPYENITDVLDHIRMLSLSMNITSCVACEITGCKIKKYVDQPDTDLVITYTDTGIINFDPLTCNTQEKLCKLVKIPFSKTNIIPNKLGSEHAGKPTSIQRVKGDGNCFFRAVSYAISNSEDGHKILREAICKYAISNQRSVQQFLRSGYQSVTSYIHTEGMTNLNTWATEFEIICTACLLQCNIYTYSAGRWLKYSPTLVNKNIPVGEQSIYLDHQDENHYNVVLRTEITGHPMRDVFENEHGAMESSSKLYGTDNLLANNDYDLHEKYKKTERKKKIRTCQKRRYATDEEYRLKKKEMSKKRYQNNVVYQQQIKDTYKRKYRDNELYRQEMKESSKEKYKKNTAYKHEKKEKSKTKYQMNEKFKQEVQKASKEKYQKNEQFKQKVKNFSKEKYQNNEPFKQGLKNASKEKYQTNVFFKQEMKKASKEKYQNNEQFKQRVKRASKEKYENNEQFKRKVMNTSKVKYQENEHFKLDVKKASRVKYHQNEQFRNQLKNNNKLKYQENKNYQEQVKKASKMRYQNDIQDRTRMKMRYMTNTAFQDKYKLKCRQKYHIDSNLREKKVDEMKKKYWIGKKYRPEVHSIQKEKAAISRKIRKASKLNALTASFRDKVSKGPVYACASCRRLLFENQVQKCNLDNYDKCLSNTWHLPKAFFVKEQPHESTVACNTSDCPKCRLWICKTCHRKLINGSIPAESSFNKMKLEKVPEELNLLNSLEHHLIALHIPFMKVVALPKGGQRAVHGPVVCVPVNIQKISMLPRSENTNLILKVKLKRKLQFKGHFEYQFINTSHIQAALKYLKSNNVWYKHIEIDDSLENGTSDYTSEKNDVQKNKPTLGNEKSNQHLIKDCIHTEINNTENQNEDDDKSIENEGENGVQYDTCLQPADIGQEVLDHYFDEIFNIAPGEGNNPVKVMQEIGNEAKCFPKHFPSGINTFDEKRNLSIPMLRYFNNRLMNVDRRFAQDTNYIFYSQYLSELKQVIEKTQISLRKGTNPSKEQITDKIQDENVLRNLLKKDEALRFLQPIRGTPSYWQKAQKDLFAMLRQLGIPTWFCSFSSAEFRWKEILEVLLLQQGDCRKYEDLDWMEKCKLLKNDPVTVARMFDKRFHVFLKDVILSPQNPIGEVIDYFYRIEFQQRGSPHAHCLFWIRDAPKLDEDGSSAVCDFIDHYITCAMPSAEKDTELHDMVNSVQQHSRNHSKSCKKKGTNCRFNFPRPPSKKTFICKENSGEEIGMNAENDSLKTMTKSDAKALLTKVWDIINQNDSIYSIEDLFKKLGINQTIYEEAHRTLNTKQSVILRRNPNEVWTNQYNAQLLRCWDANMDIQFILDPFSCIVYIISYISKAEREMGMLLRQTKIESEQGNLNAKQTMRAIGSAYLHHREVGVQEAIYRVCSLHMKECSRNVVFIPVGENPTRLSKPLYQLKRNKDETDDENLWMTNIVERYQSRPCINEFEQLCLAAFCSFYRVLAKSQVKTALKSSNTFELQNGKGYIQKRTNTDPAIIRYPRFSEKISPELYYQSMLQLFLPYWTMKQLKPKDFEMYQTFYYNGFVQFKNDKTLYKVSDIVARNRAMFVSNETAIDHAEEMYEMLGPQEDAWATLCPESELMNDECKLDRDEQCNMLGEEVYDDPIVDIDIVPNISVHVEQKSTDKSAIHSVLRNLNSLQRQTFYVVRDWCLNKIQALHPDPFHIFVTGGAGTGKSHLIKAIEYESTRLLAKTISQPDDITILLTAFTGTAAYNIGGCTIHHAFKIQRAMPIPYDPLREQALSPLRAKFEHLEILVIDEVSMLYKRLLYYIHERLVQIKQIQKPFGGVCVLAVGDFYQLPPVKQVKSERLYNESGAYPVDYWNELFKVVHLDEIMRQKEDVPFANVLNELRTRTRNKSLSNKAVATLKECIREGPEESLHVFSRNKDVNTYNNDMIMKHCKDPIEVKARDFRKDKTNGKLEALQTPCNTNGSDVIPSQLLLAREARVMLTRNIDVADGLANGAVGTIVDFCGKSSDDIDTIEVKFDDGNVGKNAGKKSKYGNTVLIERVEDDIKKGNIVRHQFPLKLAWACTAHKVQGMTTNKAVVNMDHVFCPGQAYVSLSRVTKKEGLYINTNNVDTLLSKIYADEDIAEAIEKMPKLYDENAANTDNMQDTKEIILFNVQSIRHNIQELKADTRFHNSDIICLTETWLHNDEALDALDLQNYDFHHRTRMQSYTCDNELTTKLKNSRGGGVGIYIRKGHMFHEIQTERRNIETIVITDDDQNYVLAVIYRPPVYPMKAFLNSFQILLTEIGKGKKGTMVLGDFNLNANGNDNTLKNIMTLNGFEQIVNTPTTDDGTTIDHVYISGDIDATPSIIPTYYSRHQAVRLQLKNMNTDIVL